MINAIDKEKMKIGKHKKSNDERKMANPPVQ